MTKAKDLIGASTQLRTGQWVPLLPMPTPFLAWRLKEAWAVLMGQAVAIQQE